MRRVSARVEGCQNPGLQRSEVWPRVPAGGGGGLGKRSGWWAGEKGGTSGGTAFFPAEKERRLVGLPPPRARTHKGRGVSLSLGAEPSRRLTL